jgi:hypothetical protein
MITDSADRDRSSERSDARVIVSFSPTPMQGDQPGRPGLVTVQLGVELFGRRLDGLVPVEAELTLLAEAARDRGDPIELDSHGPGQTLGMFPEEDSDVVDSRHLETRAAQHRLEPALHGLLAPPDHEVPGAVRVMAASFGQDPSRLVEVALRHLPARHSSKISPGSRSGFRIQ